MTEVRQPYRYSEESVHIVDDRVAGVGRRLNCRRCRRDLPEDQFGPVGWLSYDFRKKKNIDGRTHRALHPCCWTCRKQERGKWVDHPDYTPELDRVMGHAMSRVTAGARTRGMIVAIDKDDILGLWFRQGRRCALSGVEMEFKPRQGYGKNSRALLAPSVDRIDSRGNYVLGNVQLVAAVVNIMKSDLDEERFVKMCRMVAEHDLVRALAA